MSSPVAQLSQQAERQRSLLAGGLGAIAALLAWLLWLGLNVGLSVLWQPVGSFTWRLPLGFGSVSDSWQCLQLAGTAMASGFLFGVTYRYIKTIEQQTVTNPQLQAGTVLAFSLIRVLTLIESLTSRSLTQSDLATVALACGYSVTLFAAGAIAINLATNHWNQQACPRPERD
ncbi:MAG: hypothetical protein AAGF24_02990 [Cyanobacteria bacterium P01_H01_bin.121]